MMGSCDQTLWLARQQQWMTSVATFEPEGEGSLATNDDDLTDFGNERLILIDPVTRANSFARQEFTVRFPNDCSNQITVGLTPIQRLTFVRRMLTKYFDTDFWFLYRGHFLDDNVIVSMLGIACDEYLMAVTAAHVRLRFASGEEIEYSIEPPIQTLSDFFTQLHSTGRQFRDCLKCGGSEIEDLEGVYEALSLEQPFEVGDMDEMKMGNGDDLPLHRKCRHLE
jgi:hypothetical protein